MVGTSLVFLFISFVILSGAYRLHIHALNIHLCTPRHIGSVYVNIVEVATDLTIEYRLKKNQTHVTLNIGLLVPGLVSRVEPLRLTTYANVRFLLSSSYFKFAFESGHDPSILMLSLQIINIMLNLVTSNLSMELSRV